MIRISRRGSWCWQGRQVKRFSLGAHVPDLSSADIERIHHLWVDAVNPLRSGRVEAAKQSESG